MNSSERDGLRLGMLVVILLAVAAPVVGAEQGGRGREAPRQQLWSLTPRLQPGNRSNIHVEEATRIRTRHAGARDQEHQLATEVELVELVREDDSEGAEPGSRIVTLLVEKVAVKDDHPLHPVVFEVRGGEQPGGAAEAEADVATVDAPPQEPRIAWARQLASSTAEQRTTADASSAFEAMDGHPWISRLLTRVHGERPGERVAPGDSWTTRSTEEITGIGVVELSRTYTFRRIVKIGVRRLARVEVAVHGEPAEGASDDPPYLLRSCKGDGLRLIDLDSGRLTHEELEITVVGGTSRVEHTTKLTTSVRVIR